jgi:hypothetical protein
VLNLSKHYWCCGLNLPRTGGSRTRCRHCRPDGIASHVLTRWNGSLIERALSSETASLRWLCLTSLMASDIVNIRQNKKDVFEQVCTTQQKSRDCFGYLFYRPLQCSLLCMAQLLPSDMIGCSWWGIEQWRRGPVEVKSSKFRTCSLSPYG